MAVPESRETMVAYMPQDKRLWDTTIIPILKRDVGEGLRLVLLLYAMILNNNPFVMWHVYHPSFSDFGHCNFNIPR